MLALPFRVSVILGKLIDQSLCFHIWKLWGECIGIVFPVLCVYYLISAWRYSDLSFPDRIRMLAPWELGSSLSERWLSQPLKQWVNITEQRNRGCQGPSSFLECRVFCTEAREVLGNGWVGRPTKRKKGERKRGRKGGRGERERGGRMDRREEGRQEEEERGREGRGRERGRREFPI